jgi:glycerol uptake facilitator-like aquaporin
MSLWSWSWASRTRAVKYTKRYTREYVRPLLAEFACTCFFVYIGSGTVMNVAHRQPESALVCLALAHGLALSVGIVIAGPIR